LEDFKQNLTECLLDYIKHEELIKIFENDSAAYKYIEGETETDYKTRLVDLINKPDKEPSEWPTDGMVKVIAKCISRQIIVYTNQEGSDVLFTYSPVDYGSTMANNEGDVAANVIQSKLDTYMSEPRNDKTPILIYNIENVHYEATSIVDVPESGTTKMEEDQPSALVTEPALASCPPPTKLLSDVNPHSKPKIEYAFYTKESIQYNEKGEIDTKEAVNVFSNTEKGDLGIFTVNSGSVADVTKSIGQVIEKICENIRPPSSQNNKVEALKKKLPGLKNVLNIGRENVAPAYEYMYNTFVTDLMKITDTSGYMTKDTIKSYFIGPSAIKALLDSGPLGEGVLSAIDNQLCPCFEPLSVNTVDIEEYFKIFDSLESKTVPQPEPMEADEIIVSKKTWGADKKDIIKFLDFWVTLEYCRIFQLVSSDVLGAVNGFILLRAMIENTGFTGFITIPKGSGGELGVDNKICVYALFLNNVLKGNAQNFFKIPDNSTEKGKYEILRQEYQTLYKEFAELLEQSSDFLNVNNITSNTALIKKSVKTLMQLLEENPNGALHGSFNTKSSKFPASYNTYKIITLFADFIKTHADFFQKAINGLNTSYTSDSLTVENSAWITWLCFQLARYQQTQTVYNTNIIDPPDSVEEILSLFEQRKQMYCISVKNSRVPFQTAWYKATQQVYINEAFAGHDNKSYELTKTAIDVFGEKQTPESSTFSTGRRINPSSSIKSDAGPDTENIDMAWLDKFVQANKKNPDVGVYSEHPEDVIIKILRNTNCTCFLEAFYIPDNINIWTVGVTGASMINEREYDKKKHKLPIHKPTNGLLDIITGPKHGQHRTFIVVDLAKYVPDIISKTRSVDEIKRIFSINNDSFDETEIQRIQDAYEKSEASLDESSAEKNEAAIDLFFRNKLVEQDMLKNFNTGTVFAPIIYSVDAASFKLPNNAVFMTGKLNLPIDVGNNIMMVITFKVGTDETYTSALYSRPPAPITPLLLTDVIDDIKKDYAICLEYFYKKKNTVDINKVLNSFLAPANIAKSKNKSLLLPSLKKFSFQFKNENGISENVNMSGNYATFLKTLFANIEPGNNNYKLYLEAVIPHITSLKSKDIFTAKSSIGGLWKQLIYNIAEDDVYVAQAFIRTLKTIPDIYTEGKQTAIEECAREIDEFITFINQIQLSYISDIRTSTLISAQLQQAMTEKGITFCMCNIDKEGNIVFELTTFDKVIERFPVEVQALEDATRGAQSLSVLASYSEPEKQQDIDMSGENAFVNFALKRKTEVGQETQSKKTTKEYFEKQIENTKKNLEKNDSDYYEALSAGDTISQEFLIIQHRLLDDLLNKYTLALTTTVGGGQLGIDEYIDEDLKQLQQQLAELERKHEEYLLKQIIFTDEPLSELELAKTAAFLGPELFDNIALIQAEETSELYNKVFTMNAGDIPLGNHINPADIVLPSGTTIEDFNNTLVTVKYVDGKYYLENAGVFLKDVSDKNTPSLTQNVVENVKDAAEFVFDKLEEGAIGAEEAIAGLSTPIVLNGIEYESLPISAVAAAAAGGGFKKHTKKQRKRIKKVTKRKKNKRHNNNTKRNRGKKPKKTKRRK
jgi:anti-anti-sigma regulatory factor